jgi:long-chain acyl-CoA synthetase
MEEKLSELLKHLGPSGASPADVLRAAETSLDSGAMVPPGVWHEYLRSTAKSEFLRGLETSAAQQRWAETCFRAIRVSRYTVKHLLHQRALEYPDRTLFREAASATWGRWTYRATVRQVREIAAAFHSLSAPDEPRVAIFADNSAVSAFCDLACLCYDVLDSPLSVHFDAAILAGIIDRLKINVVVTDTEERYEILQQAAARTAAPFRVLAVDAQLPAANSAVPRLGELCKKLSEAEIKRLLGSRKRLGLSQVATVMFTSGSTGEPKGVSFSIYNLVTKRFARAAALPSVGQDEVLLCFLPLYHTFGRYLEMLGTIYWGGTYIFTGNPSFETLAALMPKINPTGLISVPVRWAQLREHCLGAMNGSPATEVQSLRAIVGSRLRWGFSAAGYLDPKAFHFFIRHGVDLVSGFGMTEATGGITMTPPGKYVDDTLGVPLPGITTRLAENGELQLNGHYVGRYLDEVGPGQEIPFPGEAGDKHWLPTGDLFRILPNGYYEIVDRLKDIYKNDRGQTVAPRRVEKQFVGVPGIKRTFLVGDRRAYNVLLIVPDVTDPMLHASRFEENRDEYFRRIVSAANKDLAPYERVVNFEVLDRDFELERGELTAKESLNRKAIGQNFSTVIEQLYRSDAVSLEFEGCRVRIPRWFYRDLSLLEGDIEAVSSGLHSRSSDRMLPIKANLDARTYLVGDLEYWTAGDTIDLGLFARQPRLWVGNPSLIAFCPCKDGWDVPLGNVSPQVLRPYAAREVSEQEFGRLPYLRDVRLSATNRLICAALFGDAEQSVRAVETIGEMLREWDVRWNDLMRRRLEALARHPLERVRCLAYQVLLLDDPTPDYSKAFPAFLESGLTFLNQESIESIAGRFEKGQLEALRRRLLSYRQGLPWPADDVTRNQFRDIFELLINFVENHPEFYAPVRAELAIWSLQKPDPLLAESARSYFKELTRRFEARAAASKHASRDQWESRLVFDDELPGPERRRIDQLLVTTNFLRQSVILAFDEADFSLDEVVEKGIWVSKVQCSGSHRRYRISINTRTGKHYDLELVLGEDARKQQTRETLYWALALAGHPLGPTVVSQPGWFDPDMRARSYIYPGELTVWEKIREYSDLRGPGAPALKPHAWRKLLIQGLSAFYRGWRNSGRQIVPGLVSPGNVFVPELDFQEGGIIASLNNWRPYQGPLSLVRPMVENFFEKVAAHYPWCRDRLDVRWIFDACLEGLGEQEGREFLEELRSRLASHPITLRDGAPLATLLTSYLVEPGGYLPLHLHNAIDHYEEWSLINADAIAAAREQAVEELYRLYQLYRFPEYVRFYLYRHTFFGGLPKPAADAFDRLLARMQAMKDVPAVQLSELSDLQDALTAELDLSVFSRMVFPRIPAGRRVEVIKVDDGGRHAVIVSSAITDRYGGTYTFRESLEPPEIGQLYRYFFSQNVPKVISEQDRYYVLLDTQERVVGGICYQIQENRIVQIEGIVVAAALQSRGIGSAMEEEFCSRMANEGIAVVRAPLPQKFYLSRGYQVNKRWGTLVKFISPEYP